MIPKLTPAVLEKIEEIVGTKPQPEVRRRCRRRAYADGVVVGVSPEVVK